jgi:hypothetical protein
MAAGLAVAAGVLGVSAPVPAEDVLVEDFPAGSVPAGAAVAVPGRVLGVLEILL